MNLDTLRKIRLCCESIGYARAAANVERERRLNDELTGLQFELLRQVAMDCEAAEERGRQKALDTLAFTGRVRSDVEDRTRTP